MYAQMDMIWNIDGVIELNGIRMLKHHALEFVLVKLCMNGMHFTLDFNYKTLKEYV